MACSRVTLPTLTSALRGSELLASRLGRFIPGKERVVPIEEKTAWTSQWVWTVWREKIRCLHWESNHNASVLQPVTSALPITLSGQCYNGLVIELTGCNSSISQGIGYMFRLQYTDHQADCENKKEEFTAPWMWGLVPDSVVLYNTHNTKICAAYAVWWIKLYRVYKNCVCVF